MATHNIAAAEKFIGAPLAWQYHQKDEPYTYFFRLNSFIAHTHGGFISIRFQLVRQARVQIETVKSNFKDKIFFIHWTIFFSIACNQNQDKREQSDKAGKQTTFRLYSKNVADSFSIFVNLPNNYNPQQKEKYPVFYLLDADLYFDIVANIFNKYS